ncbi:MAG: cupin domain-containing protein [Candidatus Marinimicrobia bacterium]|nr:cupin domain-containing protein [Candidatus Neomarinimicrobiota bacterium]MCF7827971.1 cupin domain-containing protein [Candidatus Neomarinimicrobiota bacterium]MCF7879274.1 cupin domain-containing protein [Candidatus Neomarinimicrobiota bacterium]
MTSDIQINTWNREEPPDPEQLKQQLRKEGYGGIHAFTDRPGATYGDHQHDYIEVRWLVQGEVTFGVNGEDYTLKPGDRLDMPANTVHDARIHPEKGATYICASK